MKERVVAVIVHWRDVADTLGCVESLAGEPGVEILVVDNGSPEPVAPALSGQPVTCLASGENRGYAGGGNLGIRAALSRGATTVLLLNNDARVVPGATAAATRTLASDPRIAAVGAKVLSRTQPGRLWLAWGEVTWRPSLVALRGSGEPDGPAYGTPRQVDWIAGCAMWLRAEALGAIGLLDEEFFAYHEEVDWCARARAAGWHVVYCPSAVVLHRGGGVAGGPAAIRVRKYFAARNSILFARRHGTRLQRSRLVAGLVTKLPLELLWHVPRGTAGEVLWKLRGVRDGLTGRRPPFESLGLR